MRRIALSYYSGPKDDIYAEALHRRAETLELPLETLWLGGAGQAGIAALDEAHGILFVGGAPDVAPERYVCSEPSLIGLCNTDPARDDFEWALLERLQIAPRPTLAICRGSQILNVFHGGTLIPDLGEKNAVHRRDAEGRRREHRVEIEPDSRLAGIVGVRRATANSSHHQAVGRLAPGFRANAWSPDGIIEGYEPASIEGKPFCLAVQWHPEGMEPGLPLADHVLDAFLSAVFHVK